MQIAIISDIHEDYNSLLFVIEKCQKLGIDRIICLGDITGFSGTNYKFENTRNANQCIDLIKKHSFEVVVGNHDLFSIKKIPEYNASFNYPENWYKLSDKHRIELCDDKIWTYSDENQNQINAKNQQYLNLLKEFEVVNISNIKILISHYLFPDLSGSMVLKQLNNKIFSNHLAFANSNNCNISFVGHQHPEGSIIYNYSNNVFRRIFSKTYKFVKFGKTTKLKNHSIVIVPSLAKSNRKTGFLIFDTNTFNLTVKKN